jgi:hypothetical protein
MKEQKVFITDSASDINRYLEMGWQVVFQPISQHVAIGQVCTSKEGKFLVVLEKQQQ